MSAKSRSARPLWPRSSCRVASRSRSAAAWASACADPSPPPAARPPGRRRPVRLLGGLLLVGPLRGLVLVGHLVELELEQVGEVVGDRTRAASAAAALLAAGLHLKLVLFLG